MLLRPTQWAIENDIQTFDLGAGSPDKIFRGFDTVPNTSLHRFYDLRLKILFEHFIDKVNAMEESTVDVLNRQPPFVKKIVEITGAD